MNELRFSLGIPNSPSFEPFSPFNFEDSGYPLKDEKTDEKSGNSPSIESVTSDMDIEPNISSNESPKPPSLAKNFRLIHSTEEIDFNELRFSFGLPNSSSFESFSPP